MTITDQSAPSFAPRSFVVNADFVLFTEIIAILTAVNSVLRLLDGEPEPERIVTFFWIAGIVFLTGEWILQIIRSHNRKAWLLDYRGWMEIISSLPLPLFTLLRVWRITWLARRLRSGEIQDIGRQIIVQRARTTMLVVFIAAIIVLEVGSILILRAEDDSSLANILTAGDALWWSIVTLATVGYGDKYPITTDGRVIGTIVILAGVGLFSSLTSFLAHWFLARRPERVREVADAVGVHPPRAAQIEAAKHMLDRLAADPDPKRIEAVLTVLSMILEPDKDGSKR